MAVNFTIDDGSNGKLYVSRHNDKVSFSTIGGSECWASVDDVRKLMRELAELTSEIEGA